MALKLNDKELNSLLDEVAADLKNTFATVNEKLNKSEQNLSKAAGSDPEESSPVKDDAPAAPPEASAGAPGAEASAPPDMAGPGPGAEAPAGAPGGDPAADAGLTPEALQAEYEKLPPEELQMHLQACQAALQKLMGAGPAGAGMDPSAGAGAPPPAAPPAPGPAMKSEASTDNLKKSEDLTKKELDSLKEDIEILATTVRKLIETPVRKAIVSIDELEKSTDEGTYKPLKAEDFWVRLREVAKRPDLKKSDKQLIKDIYDRKVSPEIAAKHLVKLFEE